VGGAVLAKLKTAIGDDNQDSAFANAKEKLSSMLARANPGLMA
jgi:hypothetical protein